MGADFLISSKDEANNVFVNKNESGQKDYLVWKKIIYYFSWLAILSTGLLVGLKIFFSSQILWLNEIDIILFLVI